MVTRFTFEGENITLKTEIWCGNAPESIHPIVMQLSCSVLSSFSRYIR